MQNMQNIQNMQRPAGRLHHLCVAAPLLDHGIFLTAAVPARGQEGMKR